jgi:hypothetical protein
VSQAHSLVLEWKTIKSSHSRVMTSIVLVRTKSDISFIFNFAAVQHFTTYATSKMAVHTFVHSTEPVVKTFRFTSRPRFLKLSVNSSGFGNCKRDVFMWKSQDVRSGPTNGCLQQLCMLFCFNCIKTTDRCVYLTRSSTDLIATMALYIL